MKVYGWRGFYAKGGNTPSVAAVCRATGMSRSTFNNDGSETWNDGELAKALSSPGTIFVQPLDARPGEPWEIAQ